LKSFRVRLRFFSGLFSIVWTVFVSVRIVDSIFDVVSTVSSIRGKCRLRSLVKNESTVVLFSISWSSEGFSILIESSFNSLRIILGSCTCTWRGRSMVSIGFIFWSSTCAWVSLLILRSMDDFWEVSTWGSSGFNDDDSIEWLCSSTGCSIVGNVVVGNVDSIAAFSEKGNW
jgi:hypothetical protein